MDKKLTLQELYAAYKRWVISNPNVVTDVETVATWSSYFVVGKINSSPIVSELVYSLSRLLSLFNDRIIRQAYCQDVHHYGLQEQLKLWMTVIHYFEVFAELVVKKSWGPKGKWTAATLLQIFKCTSGLILLYRFKELPINHPPVPTLQRKKVIAGQDTDEKANGFFSLRRSGRVIRCVDNAPPVAFRDWQPIKLKEHGSRPGVDIKDLMYAETLHILKPLVHLAAMRVFGTKTWKQWLIALGLDLASLKLYNRHKKNLSDEQKLEISRRKLSLVLYLLRNPMYHKYSENAIERTLSSVSNKLPMTSFVCSPIIAYITYLQDIYFYMWSS